MKPLTAIDWALDVLQRSILPPDMPAAEFNQRMMELRLIKRNGVTEKSLYCPSPGCNYTCPAPPEMEPVDPVVCPEHSTQLIIMTWKQLAGHAFQASINQTKEFDLILEAMQAESKVLGETLITMRERLRVTDEERRECLERLENFMFTTANEKEELENLRGLATNPVFQFCFRMEAEIIHNQHKGDWEDWEPSPMEILAGVSRHLDKLKFAIGKNNRAAVSEFAADIANFMLKTHELYGTR